MPRCKPTMLVLCGLVLTAATLAASSGCGNKEPNPKPPGGASYYTGDDFKGNSGKKMKGFDPTTTTSQGKQ